MDEPVGVWLVGALGGLGTTVVAGARALAHGRADTAGLTTALPEFSALDLVPVEDLVFGGHEVRPGTFRDSAAEIARQSGTLSPELLAAVEEDLLDASEALKPGTSVRCGAAIERLATDATSRTDDGLRSIVQRLQSDLRAFRAREMLDRVVVVNVASTEPDLAEEEALGTVGELEAVLDAGDAARIRPSLLYAYAAFREGCGYVNFSASRAPLMPAMVALGQECGVPFMGSDGKTGETLVKSALAPLFRIRNLPVLSWQGYNMLGDRDGRVLAHPENRDSKVRSKDTVVPGILGYDPHTHVGIDFVESLEDHKTAWDFIHFSGFLGHRMSMQFTWQGCDSILAAPLVLDLVRFTELAMRRGEGGPMPQLAPFFKAPLGVTEHSLHRQFERLVAHYARA